MHWLSKKGHTANSETEVDNARVLRKKLRRLRWKLAVARLRRDRGAKGEALAAVATTYRLLGRPHKAVVPSRRARDIAKRLINEGKTLHRAKSLIEAKARHETARRILHELDIRAGEAVALHSLGGVCISMGQIEEALQHIERALAILHEIGNLVMTREALRSLGDACHLAGWHERALTYYQELLVIDREMSDRASERKTLHRLAVHLGALGQHQRALDHAKQSLAMDDVQGSKGNALQLVGSEYAQLGEFQQALDYLEESLAIWRRTADRARESDTLNHMGLVHISCQEYQKALQCFQEALSIQGELENQTAVRSTLNNIGIVYSEHLEQHHKALEYFQDSLRIEQELGDRMGELMSYHNIAQVYVRLGQPHKAREHFESAVQIIESSRAETLREDLRVSYFEQVKRTYQDYISLLVKLGESMRALEAVEETKARAFLLQLGTDAYPIPSLSAVQQSLLEEESSLLDELRALENRVRNAPDEATLLQVVGEQRKGRDALEKLWRQLGPDVSDYVALRRGDTVHYEQMQRMVDSFGPAVALVELYTLPEKIIVSTLHSGERRPVMTQASVSQVQLGDCMRAYRREVIDYPRRGDIGQRWQERLAELLFKDVLPLLEGVELVYLVPHGSLHGFPLHAVRVSGQYLIDRFPIAYAPSATVLWRVIQRKARKKRPQVRNNALVLGYAPRKDERVLFEEEAIQVAEHLGTTNVHLGQEATGALIRDLEAQCTTLHMSCHGRFDPVDPLASGIILADGKLTARDIMALRLNTDLLTLSACETAISDRQPGDELTGLTRALLYAGASSVLVTLWQISTVAALKLMGNFYDRFCSEVGAKPAAKAMSLRRAQIWLRDEVTVHEAVECCDDLMAKFESERIPIPGWLLRAYEGYTQIAKRSPGSHPFAHPYYWASFILVGDWQ